MSITRFKQPSKIEPILASPFDGMTPRGGPRLLDSGTPATPPRARGLRFAAVACGDGLRPPTARWCGRRRANGTPASLPSCRPPNRRLSVGRSAPGRCSFRLVFTPNCCGGRKRPVCPNGSGSAASIVAPLRPRRGYGEKRKRGYAGFRDAPVGRWRIAANRRASRFVVFLSACLHACRLASLQADRSDARASRLHADSLVNPQDGFLACKSCRIVHFMPA